MKSLLFSLLLGLSIQACLAQDLQGAWEFVETTDEGVEVKHVLTFAGFFFSEATFVNASGKFLSTKGGSFQTNDDHLEFSYEYNTGDPRLVGLMLPVPYEMVEGKLQIRNNIWTQIDDGSPGNLAGAWLISGRKRDGEIVKRDTSGPRKTMKILSGTRFQWIAYNTATKEFLGTGGGTYATVDGKYTENIGFFSRDDSRVGASLEFNYELKDGDWHHSGLSSKGQPIYEVWSKRTF